jgi:hypothetical protein
VKDVEELIVVLVCDEHRAGYLADAIVDSSAAREIAVRDVLQVSGDSWRSLLCGDDTCCPPGGRAVSPTSRHLIAAEFALMGVAPMPTREDLVAEVASRPVKVAALALRIEEAAARAGAEDREEWRDEATARATSLLMSDDDLPLGDDAAIDVLVDLTDVRVRDTTLWECARLDEVGLSRAQGRLAKATGWAPPGHVAPVATCCGVLAWLRGDGARAMIALERALEDDPEYSLALLVRAAVGGGMPPGAWRDAMSGLTREECRMPRHAA